MTWTGGWSSGRWSWPRGRRGFGARALRAALDSSPLWGAGRVDRAYLSSALVRDRGPGLAVFCKAWRVRNTGGRFAKDQFSIEPPPGSWPARPG